MRPPRPNRPKAIGPKASGPKAGGPKAPSKAGASKARPTAATAKPPRRPATAKAAPGQTPVKAASWPAKPKARSDGGKAPSPAKGRPRSGTSPHPPREEKPRRYIAFHKPYDVLSQFSGAEKRATLGRFGLPTGVYAAGRLDRDSEGLLLLSNDGPFIAKLLDPEHGHPRTYLVQVEGVPERADIDRLRAGVKIGEYQTLPCRAESIDDPGFPEREPPIRKRKWIPTSWIRIVLTEGKNRQVRRMTAAIGFPTLRLVRVAIGNLTLDKLALGEWRPVTRGEIGIG